MPRNLVNLERTALLKVGWILVFLGCMILSASLVKAATAWHIFVVDQGRSYYFAPTVDRNMVAWLQYEEAVHDYRATVKDLQIGQTRSLSDVFPCYTDTVVLEQPWIVVECFDNTLHAFNFETEEKLVIGPPDDTGRTEDFKPAINQGRLLWVHANESGRDLWLYDFQNSEYLRVTQDSNEGWETHPDISGEWVVWEDYAMDIYAYNLASRERLTLTHDSAPQQLPRIGGSWIVWETYDLDEGDWNIDGYNLATRSTEPLAAGPGDQIRGNVVGDLFTWVETNERAIKASSLATEEKWTIYIFPEDVPIRAPEFDGRTLVWNVGRSGEPDTLYAARFLDKQVYLPVIVKDIPR